MNNFYLTILLSFALILQVSCSMKANNLESSFFEVKPSIKIQAKDGIDKKEANMILEMYRILSIGDVTIYYSGLESEKGKWVSRKKGHWSYRTMLFPVLIDKKNGNLRHGAIHYTLAQLVESYKKQIHKK